MRRAAVVCAALAIAGCGIPWRESFWRPSAPQGKLENWTECDLGGARALRITLVEGVLLNTYAENRNGKAVVVISFDSKGRSATFSSDNVSIIVDGAISESKLVLKNGPTGLPYYEVGVPTARGTAFIAKFPDIMIGNGVVAIPQVNYTFISRVVLKCLNT